MTRAGEYALRSLRFLASQSEGRWFVVQEIAEGEDIPPQFLAKVMQRLTQTGLVHSSSGKTGGYRLARPAGDVSLAEVVVAMEGPLALNACLLYPNECRFSKECRLHSIWGEAQEAMLGVLKKYTLSHVVQKASAKSQGSAGRGRQRSRRGRTR